MHLTQPTSQPDAHHALPGAFVRHPAGRARGLTGLPGSGGRSVGHSHTIVYSNSKKSGISTNM